MVLLASSLVLFTACDTSNTSFDYTGISMNPAKVTMQVGDTTNLIVIITVDDEVRYDLLPEFATEDSTIALVNTLGSVTALKVGTTKITASYKDVEGECIVVVEEKDTTD